MSKRAYVRKILQCIFTARKCSLRRLCFYRCLSVHREGAWSQGGVWSGGCLAWCGGGGSGPGGPGGDLPGYCCGRYASYWNAFLSNNIFSKSYWARQLELRKRTQYIKFNGKYTHFSVKLQTMLSFLHHNGNRAWTRGFWRSCSLDKFQWNFTRRANHVFARN